MMLPLSLTGQNTYVKSTGIEVSFSYDYLEDFTIHLLFNLSRKQSIADISIPRPQHEPLIGLELPIGSSSISNFGLNAGYKFYPNKNKQNFDLFFIYLLQAGSRKLYSTSTVNGFSLHNLIGYGFNIYFNDKIFLKHYIAAGIENAWFQDNGNFMDFSLVINLGIGMKITTLKTTK